MQYNSILDEWFLQKLIQPYMCVDIYKEILQYTPAYFYEGVF